MTLLSKICLVVLIRFTQAPSTVIHHGISYSI